MTDLLLGRELDLALAEVQGWENWTGMDGRRYWRAGAYGSVVSDERLPRFTLDLIAAAEEPLRKAGWVQEMISSYAGYTYQWYQTATTPTHAASGAAPDEVIARGNALLRGLEKLKEETNG